MPILDKNDSHMMNLYEEFVRSSNNVNATQSTKWSIVKNGWESEYVYLENDGHICAAMSLLINKTKFGYSLLYAPRGPICDISDTKTVLELIKEAEPIAKKYRAFALKLDPSIEYSDEIISAYKTNGFKVRNNGLSHKELIQPILNMVLDINNKTSDELIKEFAEKTRYNIRLAGRKGINVRYSTSLDDLDIFFDLYKITAERDKIGMRDKEYFERMLKAFGPDDIRIYVAEHEGTPLSSAVTICYGDRTWYAYGASSNEKRNLMPNYAMQMAMIEWAISRKCSKYDFAGIWKLDNSDGLYKFKEGFCHKFGATKYIGEIDYVYNPLIYRLFNLILKIK